MKRLGKLGFRVAAALAAACALSCGSDLDSGEWGTFRFIGRVKGPPPLAVLPPVSDRGGNLYTLYGAIGLPEVVAFATRASGGSSQACMLTKGDIFGAHGWVGFADDRAWYWSGDALVAVPAYGQCARVLAEDPKTNVELLFKAVIPRVRVTPSRSSLVALIATPTDRIPFSAVVDLDRGVTTNVAQPPVDADRVTVLGVGADYASAAGAVLLGLTKGETTTMHALFYNEAGNVTASTPVSGAVPPEYGIVGNLEFGPAGTIVGLTSMRTLVAFGRSGGRTIDLEESFEPVAVHRWKDELWLVGTAGGGPAVRRLDGAGRPGAIQSWASSLDAAAALKGALEVTDDREFPARTVVWSNVKTGVGPFPFLGTHSPWPHAPDKTLWVVAGPEFDANGRRTSAIAVAPVGISYP